MSWAQAEFHDLELGDARRTQRLIKLVNDLSAQPTGSIPLACGGWPETKAAYRLLDNPAVEWREILEVHTTRTVERMAGQPVVLCIQDTTELDFTSQPGIAGLGRLSYEAQHGLYVHPTLAVTSAGVALGVLDAWMWAQVWPDLRAALSRSAAIRPDWEIVPWVFIPADSHDLLKRRLVAIENYRNGKGQMPMPRVTYLEDVVPWKYEEWKNRPSSLDRAAQQVGAADAASRRG